MASSYYRAGTLSVTAASTAVALVGAAALSQVQPGDMLVINGVVAVIDSVTDNLNLVLADGWPGSTVTASSDWLILRTGAAWHSTVQANTTLNAIIAAIEAGLQVTGAIAIALTFSALTADADPGAGTLRLDNATQNIATTIRVDLSDARGISITGLLAEIAASGSNIKSRVKLFKTLDPTAWLAFDVSAMASPTGYRNFTATVIGSSAASPFVDGDALTLVATPNGDVGALVDHSVTNAKLVQVAQYTVKIRHSAGTGDYEDSVLGAGLVVDATSFRVDLTAAFAFTNTTDSTSTSTGALQTAGGLAVAKNVRISANGSTTAAPRVLSIEDFSTGEAARFQFGDANSSIQNTFGGKMQVQAYHGLELAGGRAGTSLAFEAGNGSSDASVRVIGNGTGNALEVMDTPAGGNLIAGFDKAGILKNGGMNRVSGSNFSKTSDTTLAIVTGLSEALQAGKTYKFRACLHVTAGATGGHKYAIAGTATATAIAYHIVSVASGATAIAISSQQTALAGSAGQAGQTAYLTTIEGVITVNTAGTIGVQFAQNVSNATASVVLIGSTLELQEIT